MTRPTDLSNISTAALLRGARKQHESEIRQGYSEQPAQAIRIDLDLNDIYTKGNPFPINFPFDGFWVVDTVGDPTVFMAVGANKGYQYDSPTPLKDNLACKYDSLNLQAFLYWPQQTGKLMSIIFFQGNDVRPGTQKVNISGLVRLQVPDLSDDSTLGSAGTATSVSCPTAGPPTQICAVNDNRAQFTFQSDVDVYIVTSASVIGTPRGFILGAGQPFSWANTGALYAQGVAADATVTGIEESFSP